MKNRPSRDAKSSEQSAAPRSIAFHPTADRAPLRRLRVAANLTTVTERRVGDRFFLCRGIKLQLGDVPVAAPRPPRLREAAGLPGRRGGVGHEGMPVARSARAACRWWAVGRPARCRARSRGRLRGLSARHARIEADPLGRRLQRCRTDSTRAAPVEPAAPVAITDRSLAPLVQDLNASAPTLSMGNRFDFLQPATNPGELGRLGAYRVIRVLGEGGMGIVFKGEDPLLERPVALKVMKPEGAADAVSRSDSSWKGSWPRPSGTITSSPSIRWTTPRACRTWPWSSWRASRSTTG